MQIDPHHVEATASALAPPQQGPVLRQNPVGAGTIAVRAAVHQPEHTMDRLLLLFLGVLRSACRSRAGLVLENAALRHQLGGLFDARED